jgi:hypothetical protein
MTNLVHDADTLAAALKASDFFFGGPLDGKRQSRKDVEGGGIYLWIRFSQLAST